MLATSQGINIAVWYLYNYNWELDSIATEGLSTANTANHSGILYPPLQSILGVVASRLRETKHNRDNKSAKACIIGSNA